MRFGPSPVIFTAMSLMLRTMSVTSSRTPGIEENSCSTPSMCTDFTAAPCSDDSSTRLSGLPSVSPNPRSSGSATIVAERLASVRVVPWSFSGLISSCQFFGLTGVFTADHLLAWRRGVLLRLPRERMVRPGRAAFRNSDAPPLARSATVMRNRCDVADRGDGEARRLQRAQRRLAARARSRHLDLERAQPVLLRLARHVLGGDLRRVGRRLPRALEPHGASRRPGDGIALHVGDGDHGVVEARVHMRDARRDVLALAAAYARALRL